MNINALNDDCLSAVFSLIPVLQLVRDRRVCKHWRQSIDNHISTQRHLIYDQVINGQKRDQYFYKYKTKEEIESLLDLNRFERCIQLIPRLLAITFMGVKANDAMFPILANNCPNLTRVHCLSGEESLTFVGFRYLVLKYPTLTHLDLPNCQLDDDLIHLIATNLQNLVHFNFSTDRSRHTRSSRLSRFTGQTLRKIGPKIRTLMIGESMYWDESLITSLTSSHAKHVTVLKLHLLKLKALETICQHLTQLKEFYCSFNGGDINTQQNNVGVIKHLSRLHSLQVLELIDDGRHHCGINGCQSIYTKDTLIDVIKSMPRLRILRLLDFDNWHSSKPCVDQFFNCLKQYCPDLTELGVSAGLLQLKTESYGLIAMLGLTRLTVQGDTSLVELPTHSIRRDYLTGQVVIDLLANNRNLYWLKVENCPKVDDESVQTILEIASKRPKKKIRLEFHNTGVHTDHQFTRPENVRLVISRDDDENQFDVNFSDSDSSWATTESDASIHLWHDSDDNEDDDSIQFFE